MNQLVYLFRAFDLREEEGGEGGTGRQRANLALMSEGRRGIRTFVQGKKEIVIASSPSLSP